MFKLVFYAHLCAVPNDTHLARLIALRLLPFAIPYRHCTLSPYPKPLRYLLIEIICHIQVGPANQEEVAFVGLLFRSRDHIRTRLFF